MRGRQVTSMALRRVQRSVNRLGWSLVAMFAVLIVGKGAVGRMVDAARALPFIERGRAVGTAALTSGGPSIAATGTTTQAERRISETVEEAVATESAIAPTNKAGSAEPAPSFVPARLSERERMVRVPLNRGSDRSRGRNDPDELSEDWSKKY